MSDAAILARRRQRIGELCAAAVRAQSGEADLHFRGTRLYRGRRVLPLFAPHLHPDAQVDDFASFRGAADGLAARLTRSDDALHRRLCPPEPVARLVFDLLEQFRVESLAADALNGVAHNLRHRFDAWSRGFHHAGLTDSARGLLLYTLAQVCRARVMNQRVTDETEDLLEATRGALAPRIGHQLAGLRRDRADQSAYARHALAIAASVGAMIAWRDGEHAAQPHDDDAERTAFALVMDVDRLASETFATAVAGRSRLLEETGDGYRVFTTAYDIVTGGGALARADLLKALRERLDGRMESTTVNIPKLARTLRALLGVPTRDGWDGGREEGTIDGRRLAQLIASPTERRLFRVERIEPVADCVVAFLVDCSGSMKQHAETVALLVDVFARALEQAGVASEVLGFTTRAWNGGRARRDWIRAGRPPHPGRLNEVCHLVFKDAETTWRRARPQIAALLRSDLFREGIDGEAVAWACGRLRDRPEQRRLLLVVSDGSPMDGATDLANDRHYLDHHLQEVVAAAEQRGDIEIHGIGVALDLSPYYRRSHVLDLSAPIGDETFREIVGTIGRRGRR